MLFFLICSLILSSCSNRLKPDSEASPGQTAEETGISPLPGSPEPGSPEPSSPESSSPLPSSPEPSSTSPSNIPAQGIGIDRQAEEKLSRMTLEEKIGQLFFLGFRKDESGQRQLGLDASLKKKIVRIQPGGYIFFGQNIDSISQTVSFIQSLQENSKIPMFIGIDEEGGIISRLNEAEKLHSTVMPEPASIGSTQKSEYAFKAAQAIAEEISSLGFNLNFAPVADVFSNPLNKIIGRRAYSSDAAKSAEMVAEAVKGIHAAGVVSVLKHFPGHGDTIQDSHSEAAITENDLERLRRVEFLPFEAGIQAGADMVMTAHILTPKITENGLPATLSEPVIQGLLRKELGFQGVIITDGLDMNAIKSFFPEEKAVVMAVQAGADMLLLPADPEKAFEALLTAVKNGSVSEERIDESVRRILKLKIKTILGKPAQTADPEKVLGLEEHVRLAEQIRKEMIP